MHLLTYTKQLLVILSVSAVLMACDSNRFFENDIDLIDDIVQLDDNQSINQSVDLFLYYPNDSISNINWQQTAGEPVTILASTSKSIAFTPTQAGDYSFAVSFTLNDEQEQTLQKTVTVDDNEHKVTARLSHTALAQNKVSHRAHLQYDTNNSNSITWQQISGPTVSLITDNDTGNTDGDLAIFFNAPMVKNDTIITFEVSATDNNNITYHDQVGVLIEPVAEIKDNAYFSDRVATVFPYNSNSPYAQEIVDCAYSNTLSSSCTLDKTPLLAAEIAGQSLSIAPTIDNIMDRVVVSHQWMGDRFKEFLTSNDPNNDIKFLLRATTAIVIAYDIRPSFYWAATGAIYLDPENLWLTANERDTINEAPDYRSNYGSDLQFVMPWRYVKDNAYAYGSYSKSNRINRTANDTLYQLTALLYHELAHANDFFPSTEWYIHDNNDRVLDAAVSSNFESDELAVSYPLASQEMRNLGRVRFAGESASQVQRSYLPTDIEGFFSSDSASDFYAYSSLREDYAMLFEELMMQHRFSIMRDIAITNQPDGESISATDYIVTWGQRGRIGDDKLKDRALFTAKSALPELDGQAIINQLPTPIEMIEGNNWIENLTISSAVSSKRITTTKSLANSLLELTDIERFAENNVVDFIPVHNDRHYHHKPLPTH
ncbi:hypothetical protein [Colwellia sp. E2M01]|uniref:hypothetical protein n=1 Tax=Colwellia sp. E2M01 TaxID=2841561 RepID=UPI001C091DCB|nr:hypothetical protein [Colwellia sp. E2M01]MBU2871287.1 hypothetical protein [Colwellia sp. E2M01]